VVEDLLEGSGGRESEMSSKSAVLGFGILSEGVGSS